MKLFSESYRIATVLVLGVCMLWSCRRGDPAWGDPVGIDMRIGADNVIGTRAFSNDDPLSVDRILVLPFTKSNALAENNTNYRAAPELAVQMDVGQFPVTDLRLFLSPLSTCRLVVLGFNRLEYDFYNRDPSIDDIVIDWGGSLADLNIEDRAAAKGTAHTTELFFDMSDPFIPGSGTSVSALLTRIVGGISVTLTYVPDGVEMRLYHTTPLTTRWMVTGEAAAGSVDTAGSYYSMDNIGGGVNYYARYYFPAAGTPVTMELAAVDRSDPSAENQIARVQVATSSGNEFNVEANRAINLSGDYRSVILGQELFVANPTDENIHIDDDNWDGVDETPETNPDGTPHSPTNP